jgi:hypothetical protein
LWLAGALLRRRKLEEHRRARRKRINVLTLVAPSPVERNPLRRSVRIINRSEDVVALEVAGLRVVTSLPGRFEIDCTADRRAVAGAGIAGAVPVTVDS